MFIAFRVRKHWMTLEISKVKPDMPDFLREDGDPLPPSIAKDDEPTMVRLGFHNEVMEDEAREDRED